MLAIKDSLGNYAGMVELVDTLASGASDIFVMEVQILLPAPLLNIKISYYDGLGLDNLLL